MTESAVVHTDLPDAEAAGAALGNQIRSALNGQSPDAVLLFAAPRYDHAAMLEAIHESCHPKVLVGCSSAGEFTSTTPQESSACAVALRSAEMQFRAGIGRNLSSDRSTAAQELVSSFSGMESQNHAFRTAVVLTDALAGYVEDLVQQITLLTAGNYQLLGGGAGDDDRFQRTHVFYGREACLNAAVALEILSNKPIGIGVSHGWTPASAPLRVTESEGARIISLNAMRAVEAFEEFAEATQQKFDTAEPLPFFLHNVLGIQTDGNYKLRVPLAVNDDGSISCAADIPTGSTVCIMSASGCAAGESAARAMRAALRQLDDHRPKVALFFDCVATRLRTGRHFGIELESLQEGLRPAHFAGCNTYGQIARAEGQFGGFHNCTAVVGIIPE